MSQITGADKNAETIFQQTTADETQELTDNPKFSVIYKGHMTRSTILETKYPGDSGVQKLTVDGPGDNFIMMDSRSRINIRTGPRNPAIGAGSGALNINAGGGGIPMGSSAVDDVPILIPGDDHMDADKYLKPKYGLIAEFLTDPVEFM